MKNKISDNDFKLLKQFLPLCTNIYKPNKKAIVKFYKEMNNALDNYEMGRIDNHPDIIKRYNQKRKARSNSWMLTLGSFKDYERDML